MWQVSRGGAGEHFWSADGSHLYYGRKSRLTAVPVTVEPDLELGTPIELPWSDNLTVIDALPNGREFIAIRELYERPKIDAVRVVVNPD